MAIDNGVDKIKEMRGQQKARTDNRERQGLFNRLHVTLMQAPGFDREQTRLWLAEVEAMKPPERIEAIRARFGEQVLNRAMPALNQLEHVGL